MQIRTVAISQPQARHTAVLAHASHDQEVGKSVGNREETRDRISREINERLVDDYELQILCLVHKIDHLLEGDELARWVAGVDDKQSLDIAFVHPSKVIRRAEFVALLGIERIELSVALILHFLKVLTEGWDWHRDAVDQSRIDECNQFGRSVTDNQILGVNVQDGRKTLTAHDCTARRIGLDEVRKISLQILEHFRSWVIRVGDEAKVEDVFRFFVSHQLGQGRRVRGLVKKMTPQLSRRVGMGCSSRHCAFHASAYRPSLSRQPGPCCPQGLASASNCWALVMLHHLRITRAAPLEFPRRLARAARLVLTRTQCQRALETAWSAWA